MTIEQIDAIEMAAHRVKSLGALLTLLATALRDAGTHAVAALEVLDFMAGHIAADLSKITDGLEPTE
ncbi:hypothetical protein SAMN06295912_13546 [Sphingomonas laterariae]|uniref:Uncharacterized protein n=1 Tax=Edaphosphingomonas laterariae TaxID=861865 RepID=A0A239JK60_9SPHN|nr:hypothetical protein [Sphingomonas laterariae]SNT06237.1 hypothetical protein SAMN06295912_13546 [Sphingomonas laterariae]